MLDPGLAAGASSDGRSAESESRLHADFTKPHGAARGPRAPGRRSRISLGLGLGSVLEAVTDIPCDRVLLVRHIRHLGGRSEITLREYCSAFGFVEQVLVPHGFEAPGVRTTRRHRRANIAFVVMAQAVAAERVLLNGSDLLLEGHPVHFGLHESHSLASSSITVHDSAASESGGSNEIVSASGWSNGCLNVEYGDSVQDAMDTFDPQYVLTTNCGPGAEVIAQGSGITVEASPVPCSPCYILFRP